jgi:hypothetical protein
MTNFGFGLTICLPTLINPIRRRLRTGVRSARLRRAAPSRLRRTPPSQMGEMKTLSFSSSPSEAWGGGPRNAVEGPRESAEDTVATLARP